MKSIIKVALLSTAIGFSASANAVLVDFIDMADNTIGEKGFATLTVGGLLKITGHASDDDENVLDSPDLDQFAYLDKGNAGLGVCKDLTGSAQCDPGSDDNVTENEWLTLTALDDIEISSIWFNNNHDEGFGTDDKINIGSDDWLTGTLVKQDSNGVGYLDDAEYTMDISLAAGESLVISYNNEQFYMSAIEFVPEPSVLALFGLGVVGIGFAARRRRTQA